MFWFGFKIKITKPRKITKVPLIWNRIGEEMLCLEDAKYSTHSNVLSPSNKRAT